MSRPLPLPLRILLGLALILASPWMLLAHLLCTWGWRSHCAVYEKATIYLLLLDQSDKDDTR